VTQNLFISSVIRFRLSGFLLNKSIQKLQLQLSYFL